MTKKLDCENEIVVQPNDKADFLKKSISLDKIVVKVLDREVTTDSNKIELRQKTNFGNGAVVRLHRLVTRDEIFAKALYKADIRINMIKRSNFKSKVITRV